MLRAIFLLTSCVVYTSASNDDYGYGCPKKFVGIGKKCYFFSKEEVNWQDAYFRCLALKSNLAIVTKPHQELNLRRYLNKQKEGRYERWLGGRYNDKQSKWLWATNGKPLTFYGFSRLNYNSPAWAWHCIILDPSRQNKWGAKSCVAKSRFVCQKSLKKLKTCDNNSIYAENCVKTKNETEAPGFYVKPKKPVKRYNYAAFICPSHMILVGRNCYFFSTEKLSWSDAYWTCRDNNTKLAVLLTRIQDNILRGFLRANFTTAKHERWVGGIFDWKQNKWKWAMSGKTMKYKNFAKDVLAENRNNTQHCATLDPNFDNLWNSRNRLERKHFICQARPKGVVAFMKNLKPNRRELTRKHV